MRISDFRLSLLLILTAGVVPRFVAAAPTGESPLPIYLVVTTKGDTIQALAVEPQPFDMVRVTTPAGEYSDISAVRIRRVLDESGRDRTKEVLERRRAVGKPGHSLCWRGKPECGSFIVTELGALYRMDENPFPGADWRVVLTFDLGYMKNVSSKAAVGATGYALIQDDITRLGIRPRYRRWLSHDTSVDISPGILLSGEDPAIDYDPPGFVLGVTGNVRDLIALTLETEYSRYRDYGDAPGEVGYQTRSDWTIRGGAKLGSGLGLAGAAAYLGLLILVVASGAAE